MLTGFARTARWLRILCRKLFCVRGGLWTVCKMTRLQRLGFLPSCDGRMLAFTSATDRNWLILKNQSIADSDENEPDQRMDRRLLHEAIAKLEKDYREPLMLQVIGGFSGKEIAEILELNNNTVMTRLFRARGKLKQVFFPNAELTDDLSGDDTFDEQG